MPPTTKKQPAKPKPKPSTAPSKLQGRTLQIDWEWAQRQIDAINAREEVLLYGGAKGGGKSFFLCRWGFLQCAWNFGNRGFLGRKRSVNFTDTTLVTWKKTIPIDLYTISESKKKIYLPFCEGQIDYGGFDDEKTVKKFNSAEYGFVGVDQAEEISRDEYGLARGTLRHKLPNGREPIYQMRLTANPADCWLRDDFILNPKDGYRFIKSLPSDNPFLPKSYVDKLKDAFGHREELLRAYLYGSWDDLTGHENVMKISWIEQCVNQTRYRTNPRRIVVVDPAQFGNDETVIYCFENETIIDSDIYSKRDTMETAGLCVLMKTKHKASLIAGDSIGIGAGIFDRLREMGQKTRPINSAEKSTDPKYFNIRAEMWWHASKMFFENKPAIPNDPKLKGQLATAHYRIRSDGKIQIESNDDIKKRTSGKSLDRASACVMGLWAVKNAPLWVDSHEWKFGYHDDQRRVQGTHMSA